MKTKIRKNKTGIIGIVAAVACAIVLVSAPAFATVVLEVHSDTTENGSTAFTDSSGFAHSVTPAGDAKHSTVEKKFGASSMRFDGDGDYLISAGASDYDIYGNDFTIDFWMKTLVTVNSVFDLHKSGTAYYSTMMYIYAEDILKVLLGSSSGGGSGSNTFVVGSNTSIVNGDWHHIAVVSSAASGNTVLYVDGSNDGFAAIGTCDAVLDTAMIGGRFYNNVLEGEFNGYIDDFYIRKGEALEVADLDYIILHGGRMFEAERYIDSANTTWGLGYSQGQIDLLAELYSNGKYGQSPADVAIGDLTWSYLDGTLPGDEGYAIGTTYMYGGKWYIKLGSGLEGALEVPNGAGLIIALVFGLGAICKKRFLNNSLLQE